MVIGLDVPLASKNVEPESSEYWYLDRGGMPPDESVNATLNIVSTLSIGETDTMDGAVPNLDVLVDEEGSELGYVNSVPDTARNITEYDTPAVNPEITIGLDVPLASTNVAPESIEY